MAISLHQGTVARFEQTLAAVDGFLEKGRTWCADNGVDLADVVSHRLRDDMLPFHFQVVSVWHHSLGAIKGVKAGSFSPPPQLELDYAGLQGLVSEARAELGAMSAEDINGLAGRDMVFKLGKTEMPFVAEDFLLSFSLPNFFFHAATAYDILRIHGVPIGKRDFLGQLSLKG
ncbi:MAG: DUF1993 domain-containing protein [Pseudomonadota bacterium]